MRERARCSRASLERTLEGILERFPAQWARDRADPTTATRPLGRLLLRRLWRCLGCGCAGSLKIRSTISSSGRRRSPVPCCRNAGDTGSIRQGGGNSKPWRLTDRSSLHSCALCGEKVCLLPTREIIHVLLSPSIINKGTPVHLCTCQENALLSVD